MSDSLKGVLAMALASTIWGLSSMYYKLLAHVPPLEVLSHRTLWSLVFFLLLLTAQGRLSQMAGLARTWRALPLILFAAAMISTNWFFFIYAVQVGRAIEASFGYYIFPLVAVMLGWVIFRERLHPWQWMAVGFAATAVVLLATGLRIVPGISLMLAVSFGLYGAAKKHISAGPVLSVSVEVLLLAPLALIWLWGVHTQGWMGLTARAGGYFGAGWYESLLLIFAGPLTAAPLVLFSYASRRVSYATVGLVQYLNPTLQATVAVLVFGEPFTIWHMLAFALIWAGLAIYSADSYRRDRRARLIKA